MKDKSSVLQDSPHRQESYGRARYCLTCSIRTDGATEARTLGLTAQHRLASRCFPIDRPRKRLCGGKDFHDNREQRRRELAARERRLASASDHWPAAIGAARLFRPDFGGFQLRRGRTWV